MKEVLGVGGGGVGQWQRLMLHYNIEEYHLITMQQGVPQNFETITMNLSRTLRKYLK